MIWSSRERNRSCSLLSRRSRGRIANPRSISSSEKNHGLRFEGILKIDLQGNRPPKAKNRQIRLLERAQSSSLFNSFLNSSRATTPSCVVSFEIVQFLHFPMIAPTKSMGWRYRHLKRLRTYIECDKKTRFFNFVVLGDTSTLNTEP